MSTGTVKWYNAQKGYSFIWPDEGSKVMFVHVSAVKRAGDLRQGQKTSYETESDERSGKTPAANSQTA